MKYQSGNALFLILIAVALFAALSYAITSSGRGGGGIDREKKAINASQVLQYAASVQQAIQRMQMVNGCSDTQISFAYDSNSDGSVDASDDYWNASAPSECYVFGSDGGGLVFNDFTAETYTPQSELSNSNNYGKPMFVGGAQVLGVGSDCDPATSGDTSCKDLLLWFHYMDPDLCKSLNENLGIDISSYVNENVSNISDADNWKFTGTYNATFTYMTVGDEQTELQDQYAGCIYRSWFPDYLFYYVLIAR